MSSLKKDSINTLGIIFLVIAVLLVVFGYFFVHEIFSWNLFINDFYANLAAEIGSIAITIIIVDRIVRKQEIKQNEIALKNSLLRDLHSPVNSVANNAVHHLRALRKLTGNDAWTKSAELGGKANLKNARLYDANFSETRLIGANFEKADLRNVNFENADLTGVNLYEAKIDYAKFNENTTLPDGHFWSSNIDLSKYLKEKTIEESKNWLDLIDTNEITVKIEDLRNQKATERNLKLFLKILFPDRVTSKDELHFLRHWKALFEFEYKTIGEIEDLLFRTEEARNWIWDGRIPEYSIIHVSFSITLENPKHLNLIHWNNEAKDRIREARKKFYNLK